MPSRLPLLRRLGELRRRYTGESTSTAAREVHNALSALRPEERKLLRDSLDSTKQQPLPSHVRASLISNAATSAQQWLETVVLHAASRISFTEPKAIWAVTPHSDGLVLHVHPEAIAALLRELMPRETDVGLHGVPALRVRSDRRSLRLYLYDSELGAASVRIASVSVKRFLRILDVVDAERLAGDPLRWVDNEPAPLRPAEQDLLPAAKYASVASGLLRRIRLFPTIPEVALSPGRDAVALDWRQGPSTARVLLDLAHPVAGLPTMTTVAESPSTHLVLGTDHATVWLRGPDLHSI